MDSRNNQLIITDTATIIQRAKQIVQKIDTVTPQVVIEARIVEAITSFSREIGFDWGTVTLGALDIPGTSYEFGPTQFTADNIPADFAENASLTFNLFKTSGTPFSIVEAQLAAAEAEGKTDNARRHYGSALAYGRDSDDRSILVRAAIGIAGIDLDRGNVREAATLVEEIRPLGGSRHDFQRLEAQLAIARGDETKAPDILVALRKRAGESWKADDDALLSRLDKDTTRNP